MGQAPPTDPPSTKSPRPSPLGNRSPLEPGAGEDPRSPPVHPPPLVSQGAFRWARSEVGFDLQFN